MKCKNCKKNIDSSPSARDMGKKGGKKSVREISPEQQEALQAGVNKTREKKRKERLALP